MKKALCLILALMLCMPGISAFADIEGTVQGDIMLTSIEDAKVETADATATSEQTTEANGELVFDDIVAGSALGDAVYKLVEAGVIAGYGDGTFRPESGLTRAELCKMINLVFGLSESASETEFTDVSEEDWYYSYVLVAVKAGYIKGFQDNTFRGDDPVTREQVCAIINRVTTAKGVGLFDLPFTDNIMDEVSDWALEDVKKIIANYIMPLEDGKFRATEDITRAELALALQGFIVELPEYTVTFDTKGGNAIEDVIVKEGSTVAKPKDPTKKNNTFQGWYTDEKLKNAYDFSTAVTADITLYAKWTPTSTGGGVSVGGGSYVPPTSSTTYYTVTFNSKGGSAVESQSVASGSAVSQPSAPEKEFHIFLGWYKDSALTTAYDFSSPVTGNLTLYAAWEEDQAAITAQRIADLQVIKEVMNGTEFTNEYHIQARDITLATVDLVVADGMAGTIITEDYIKTTYGDRISQAKTIYDDVMLPSEQDSFKELVVDMITECQSRGIKMTLSEIYVFFWEF